MRLGWRTLESCADWKFLSAPAQHPQILNPPSRNLKNLSRCRPAPAGPPNPPPTVSVPNLHLSRKTTKTHATCFIARGNLFSGLFQNQCKSSKISTRLESDTFSSDHVIFTCLESKAQPRGAEGAQAPPLAIRILMFIFLVFHQHCTVNRDRVHYKMFFGSTTGVATHSLSYQAVMNFRDLKNIEAAFFIPACFALPYITRAGCCRALPVWKQAWHLNYQQCRLMCCLYVTNLGSS